MNIKYIVELTADERQELKDLGRGGTVPARQLKRSQILLMAERRATDKAIAAALSVGTSTVFRVRRRFVEGGLQHALYERQRVGGRRKLKAGEVATLVATACSEPPEGRARWTLELLADRLVVLTDHDEISTSTISRRLAENELKPWQKRMWCIPRVTPRFVAAMEDVLDLYAEEAPHAPVVCFDETPVQLVGETRKPIPARPGRPAAFDYEYRRAGTANIFMFVDAHRSWRHAKVTARRTNIDFAECMKDLVDEHYPDAPKIRVVLDNLSTHHAGSLYEAFPAPEARRILKRIRFHHTPKHGSWLNMAEIEIGVLSRQCLSRRIGSQEELSRETAAWNRERNATGAKINWLFEVDHARTKLARHYPNYDEARLKRAA